MMRELLVLLALLALHSASAAPASCTEQAGGLCQYCRYATLCQTQCPSCPCVGENCDFCSYCEYCSLANACESCEPGGALHAIDGTFSTVETTVLEQLGYGDVVAAASKLDCKALNARLQQVSSSDTINTSAIALAALLLVSLAGLGIGRDVLTAGKEPLLAS
eukprot:gnl/TRDRNA2_/TRDRNA2_193509_c0_seq1.p1 gnl/TRDRNA2_/TRDRNA2_193509_c0~~gnl/TRDRNA2_/TRDRNA2_193509_c0_seq1.p1  ORF type:complete len:163 (-),score=20.34 gnl/TRDRNA2_/TRDRNA2_193509_c0_seq1:70-558(-)